MLHDESLAEHGGASGLRDEGLLAAALARPLNLLAHGDPATPRYTPRARSSRNRFASAANCPASSASRTSRIRFT